MSLAIDLAAVRRLEELAFRGWPAPETQDRAGWRLRFADGYTKRANSINALGHNAQTNLSTLQSLEAAYRARNQAPVWRLSPRVSPSSKPKAVRWRWRSARSRAIIWVCSTCW